MGAKLPAKAQPERRKHRTFTLTDFLVSVICLTGAVLAFLFFLRDLNSTLTKVNESPVGTVHYKYKVAQRRFHERLVWDMLKQDSSVYSGDMIHTAALGEASIVFSTGGRIDLGENCMIQIFYDEEGATVELMAGRVDIYTGNEESTLKVVQGGAEVRIAAESMISANSNLSGGANIQVAQGSAEIITKSGGRQETIAGQSIALSSSGAGQEEPQVTPVAPVSNRTLISSGGGAIPVDFAWKTQNFSEASRVRFEVSRERRFSRLVEGITTPDEKGLTVSLKPGVYWWRVYPAEDGVNGADGVDGADAAAENRNAAAGSANALVNKFVVMAFSKPELISPRNGAVFSYRTKNPQVRFLWREKTGADGGASGGGSEQAAAPPDWRIVVSNNAELNEPVIAQTVQERTFTTSALDAGRWYWRVEPVFGMTEDAGSASLLPEIAAFTIEQTSDAGLKPVELSLPAQGAFLNIAGTSPPVNFIWRDEPEADVYHLSVARDAGFADTVFTRDVRESRFVFQNQALSAGAYFWRVGWKNADGEEAPPSAARQFTALQGDVVFENVSPAENWGVSEPALAGTRFSWRTNLGAAGRLQAASDESFYTVLAEIPAAGTDGKTVFGVTRGENAAGLKLPEGAYYWRVWTPPSGTGGALYTAPRRFEVRRVTRAVLQSPPNRAELAGLDVLRKPPVLVWASAEQARSSRLVLSRNPNPEEGKPVFAVDNPAQNVPLPPLEPGVYYWTVKAEAVNGMDISPAAPFSFTIRPAPLLPQAVLTAPADGVTITANELRANRRIEFAWNAVRGANAYILSIYRPGGGTRGAAVFTSEPVRATRYAFTRLELLDADSFVWQIEPLALDAENHIEQRGAPASRRFTIGIVIPESKRYPDEQTYGLEQ